jgi:hypothetical protein
MSAEYVGKNSIEGLKVSFKYKRYTATDETLIINDSTYSIDWCRREMTVEGRAYSIHNATCLPSKNMTRIVFDGKCLTLKYSTDWQRLVGYELK